MVLWLSHIHKEGNEPCFICTIKYDCITFTSHVNVLKENTLSEPKVSKYNYVNLGVNVKEFYLLPYSALTHQNVQSRIK